MTPLPDCRLGGACDLVSRDAIMGGAGVSQCVRCSQVYEALAWRPRVCAHCGMGYGESLHDPCLGELPGVDGACCGHGDASRRYIYYTDGRREGVSWR